MNAFDLSGMLFFYAVLLFVSTACFLERPVRAAKARGEEYTNPALVDWVVIPLLWALILAAVAAFIVGAVHASAGTP